MLGHHAAILHDPHAGPRELLGGPVVADAELEPDHEAGATAGPGSPRRARAGIPGVGRRRSRRPRRDRPALPTDANTEHLSAAERRIDQRIARSPAPADRLARRTRARPRSALAPSTATRLVSRKIRARPESSSIRFARQSPMCSYPTGSLKPIVRSARASDSRISSPSTSTRHVASRLRAPARRGREAPPWPSRRSADSAKALLDPAQARRRRAIATPRSTSIRRRVAAVDLGPARSCQLGQLRLGAARALPSPRASTAAPQRWTARGVNPAMAPRADSSRGRAVATSRSVSFEMILNGGRRVSRARRSRVS